MWSVADRERVVVLYDQGFGLGAEGPLAAEFWEWKATREGPVAVTPTGPMVDPLDADEVGDYLLARVFLDDTGVTVDAFSAPAGVDETMGPFSADMTY
jgi:hypothetical protein